MGLRNVRKEFWSASVRHVPQWRKGAVGQKVKSTMVGLLPPLLPISDGLRLFPKPSQQCVKSDLYAFFNSLFQPCMESPCIIGGSISKPKSKCHWSNKTSLNIFRLPPCTRHRHLPSVDLCFVLPGPYSSGALTRPGEGSARHRVQFPPIFFVHPALKTRKNASHN